MFVDTPAWKTGPASLLAGIVLIGMLMPVWGLLREVPATLTFENRAASAFPEPPTSWQESLQWPSRFEDWFTDRALGREAALEFSRSLLFRFAKRAPTDLVFVGRDGFLFFKGEYAQAFDHLFLSWFGYDDAALAKMHSEFERRTQWFAEQGMPYFMVVVPEKFTACDDKVPRRFAGGAPVKRMQQVESAFADFDNFLSL